MKYTIPLHIFFRYTRIMEKDFCRGLYTSLFCVIIPTLFPYFLRFWYPYILLHFKCFFLLVNIIIIQELISVYTSCKFTLASHIFFLELLTLVLTSVKASSLQNSAPAHSICTSCTNVYTSTLWLKRLKRV